MQSEANQDILVSRLRTLREKSKKVKEEVKTWQIQIYGQDEIFKDVLIPIKHSMDITAHVLRCKWALGIYDLPQDLFLEEDEQALFLFDVMNFPPEMIKDRISARLKEVPS